MPYKDYSYAYSNLQKSLNDFKEKLYKILPEYSLAKPSKPEYSLAELHTQLKLFILEDKESLKDKWYQVSNLRKLLREVIPMFTGFTNALKNNLSSPLTKGGTDILTGDLLLSHIEQDSKSFLKSSSFDLLITAIKEKDENLISKIISEVPLTINYSDDDGWDAVHYCAAYGNKKIMDTLIDKYKCRIDSRTEYSYTPLHIALKSGNKEALISLLEHGADSSLTDRGGKSWIDFIEIGFPQTKPIIEKFSEAEEPILEYKEGHFVAGESSKQCVDEYL